MEFFWANRHRRRVYLIALILLAFLVALLWQRFQIPQPLNLTTTKQVKVSQVNEPIQPIPFSIALDQDKVALGKQLFQDVRLSKENRVSCLSCHSLSTGGVERTVDSVGVISIPNRDLYTTTASTINTVPHSRTEDVFDSNEYRYNTLTVFNSGFNFLLNWDGKFENLTDQLDALLQNPQLMGSNWEEVINLLRQSTEYVQAFTRIYPDGLSRANIKDAIATYEQSLYTPNSRFDQFLRGNKQALTAREQEGYRIFKAYGCVSCHQGVNVGGNMFQRFGVIGDYFADRGNITKADLGRFNITKDSADRYVFRVASLRNVALTPPYFHDGSAKTLEDAISIMTKYQLGRSLSKEQINLIAQFLRTLTGEYQGKPL